MNRLDREDYEFLTANAQAARAQGIDNFHHLDQPIGRWNYIRIANELAQRIPAGRILDWGCGFGHMTYLLRRRGFEVTAFEVETAVTSLPGIPLCNDLQVVRSAHPTKLPFPDQSFDAVLSCGVLEHIEEFSQAGNELKSLHEIRRVLRRDGFFAIYYLPQRYAWQEALARQLRLGYSHPRRYTAAEIRELLERAGYRVERLCRANLFPKNVSGLPEPLRSLFGRFGRTLIALDGVSCRIPGLNQVAGVMEIIARAARL